MPLSFLLIGIAMKELASMVGPEKAAGMAGMIQTAIAKDEARFVAAGLKYELMSVEAGAGMEPLEAKLKENKFDGVCIGFGLRSTPAFTPLFERLVNTVHTASPSSKLLFNVAPDNSLDAAKRWFPEIENEAGAEA